MIIILYTSLFLISSTELAINLSILPHYFLHLLTFHLQNHNNYLQFLIWTTATPFLQHILFLQCIHHFFKKKGLWKFKIDYLILQTETPSMNLFFLQNKLVCHLLNLIFHNNSSHVGSSHYYKSMILLRVCYVPGRTRNTLYGWSYWTLTQSFK